MNHYEFFEMSDEEQVRWVNEHSSEEVKALLDDLFTCMDSEVLAERRKEQQKMKEISESVANGNYSGITSDGSQWQLCFDYDDCHVYYDGEVII